MGFEKFTQKGRILKPVVSIWNRGLMSLNRASLSFCDFSGGDSVIFFFDRETNRIGFQIAAKDEVGAIRSKPLGSGALININPFLKYYGVNFKETKRYSLTFDEANNMYVIDLKAPLR